MEAYLPDIWAGLIAVSVALYVVLDGFDLGVGILFPFTRNEGERDQMMNSVAPFWDGNETWLVLGGGGLFVAFPQAFAVIMPAMYLPVILMLLALVFRGVAFEFRWVSKPNHRLWDAAFIGGSTLAAFAQGLILGGLLDGITVGPDGQFAGGTFDFLTPFSVMCGLGLVAGYALIGATWLIMRTSGPLEVSARRWSRVLMLAVLGFILLVSVWTPLQYLRIALRWFDTPQIYVLWLVPVITAAVAYAGWRGLGRPRPWVPFASTIGLFLLSFLGLAISTYPYLVPPSLTIEDAAADPGSQLFMLVGMVVLLPMILGYSVLVYWTFRGKVEPGVGYH
jgi:cytochrome d ubiquinol oxidase subunit II